jgi:hypothetical protein
LVAEDVLVIAEEYGNWSDSNRRVDLLGVDKQGNLVVIELKRTEDAGHSELQAIRYASMVSRMTFDQAVDAFAIYRKKLNEDLETDYDTAARAKLEGFLEGDIESFNRSVRVVLVSADFSKEVTSSVLWLNEQGLEITCVRLRPYCLNDQVLLDIHQVIPLPEAAEFQVAIQQQATARRVAERNGRDYTKYALETKSESFSYLNKRNLVFHVVESALALGLSPDVIKACVTWRKIFFELDGALSVDELQLQLPESQWARFFLEEDQVFRYGGKTFVLSNQWGVRTEEAVAAIIAACPANCGISFHAM